MKKLFLVALLTIAVSFIWVALYSPRTEAGGYVFKKPEFRSTSRGGCPSGYNKMRKNRFSDWYRGSGYICAKCPYTTYSRWSRKKVQFRFGQRAGRGTWCMYYVR
ncbi:MAG: hypothetical protein GY849_01175 [Deltaproteobacteria bacterium]|nr:hypothetical protein [Deltaproteobacteria bacterium]